MILTNNYISDVAGPREKYSDVVVPNGQTWEIEKWWGEANLNRDTHVAIIWDYEGLSPEYLAITYVSSERLLNKRLIGDGVKRLAIILRNDTAFTTETLGAGYSYRVI